MRRICLGLIAVLLMGCDVFTGSQPSLTGKWLYRGNPTGCPVTLVLKLRQDGSRVSGTALPSVSGCRLKGRYVVLPPDSSITVTGIVHGDRASLLIRMWDQQISHSAVIRGDSLDGTVDPVVTPWAPGIVTGATFGARRNADHPPAGRFMVVTSGSASDTLEGRAIASGGEIAFFFDDGGQAMVFWANDGASPFPLRTGTYHASQSSSSADAVGGSVHAGGAWYTFRDGTMTITDVKPNPNGVGYVKGTVDLTADRQEAPGELIRVQGEFYPELRM